MLREHIIALFLGFIMDLLAGDPRSFPHFVVFTGKIISFLEGVLYPAAYRDRNDSGKGEGSGDEEPEAAGLLIFRGTVLVLAVIIITIVITTGFIYLSGLFFAPYLRIALEALICWQCLAVKSLRSESMKVYYALDKGDIMEARKCLSMIVGRDTENLCEDDIVRATVETVAESTCDGVIAPLFYLAVGGPVAGAVYKAVNTMDSMIGYRNNRYEYFGKTAARLDDIFNLIPSRIAAIIMILVSFIHPGLSGRRALKIWLKDRYRHDSINAGQTESVAAGALNLRLGGDTYYNGQLKHREVMGVPEDSSNKDPDKIDIRRINNLMFISALCALIIAAASIYIPVISV